jgi:hypothetical protein
MDMAQTDQNGSADERNDMGPFTAILNGMREIVESLAPNPPRVGGWFGIGLDAAGNIAEQGSDGGITDGRVSELVEIRWRRNLRVN